MENKGKNKLIVLVTALMFAVMLALLAAAFFVRGNGRDTQVSIAICGDYDEDYEVSYDIMNKLRGLGVKVTMIDGDDDISEFAGLVIPGGIDVDPSFYGEDNTACEWTDTQFDQEQLTIIDKFVSAGKPILGICRGLQLLNVYFGGTLNQNIEGHRNTEHSVTTAVGSVINSICGDETVVFSTHHQSIKDLAADLTATAWADDGTIEAVEHSYLPIIAVQWHPEWTDTEVSDRLLEYFINDMCGGDDLLSDLLSGH